MQEAIGVPKRAAIGQVLGVATILQSSTNVSETHGFEIFDRRDWR